MNLFILCVLTLSVAPAVLAVWVFGALVLGYHIVPDVYNPLELMWASISLVLILVAWVVLFVRMVKGG